MKLLILLFPIILLLYFVISIILYNKRKKILKHYNDAFGYISSFIFASFIIAPLLVGVPMYIFGNEAKVFAPFTLIYCIPAWILYFIKRKQCPMKHKTGLFWAMLSIGLCAPIFIIYYCIVEFVKSAAKGSPGSSQSYTPEMPSYQDNARITNNTGATSGYYYSDSGRFTNQDGSTAGYYDKNSGRLTNAYGKTIGYVDNSSGRISDECGNLKGYIGANGRISDECGRLMGYIR